MDITYQDVNAVPCNKEGIKEENGLFEPIWILKRKIDEKYSLRERILFAVMITFFLILIMDTIDRYFDTNLLFCLRYICSKSMEIIQFIWEFLARWVIIAWRFSTELILSLWRVAVDFTFLIGEYLLRFISSIWEFLLYFWELFLGLLVILRTFFGRILLFFRSAFGRSAIRRVIGEGLIYVESLTWKESWIVAITLFRKFVIIQIKKIIVVSFLIQIFADSKLRIKFKKWKEQTIKKVKIIFGTIWGKYKNSHILIRIGIAIIICTAITLIPFMDLVWIYVPKGTFGYIAKPLGVIWKFIWELIVKVLDKSFVKKLFGWMWEWFLPKKAKNWAKRKWIFKFVKRSFLLAKLRHEKFDPKVANATKNAARKALRTQYRIKKTVKKRIGNIKILKMQKNSPILDMGQWVSRGYAKVLSLDDLRLLVACDYDLDTIDLQKAIGMGLAFEITLAPFEELKN